MKKLCSVLLSVLLVFGCFGCLLTGTATTASATAAETMPENLFLQKADTATKTIDTTNSDKPLSWFVWGDEVTQAGTSHSLIFNEKYYQVDFDLTTSADVNPETSVMLDAYSNAAAQEFAYMGAVSYDVATPGVVKTEQSLMCNTTKNPTAATQATVAVGSTRHYTYVFAAASAFVTTLQLSVNGLTAGSVQIANPALYALEGTEYDTFVASTISETQANKHAFRYLVKDGDKVFLRVYGYGVVGNGGSVSSASLSAKRGNADVYDVALNGGHPYATSFEYRHPVGATNHHSSKYAPIFDVFETLAKNYTADYAEAIAASNPSDTMTYWLNHSGGENKQLTYTDVSNGYSYNWSGANSGMRLRRLLPSGSVLTKMIMTDKTTGSQVASQTSTSSSIGREIRETLTTNNWCDTQITFTAFGQTLEEAIAGAKASRSATYYAYIKYRKDDSGNWLCNTTANAPVVMASEVNTKGAVGGTIYTYDVMDIDNVKLAEVFTLAATSKGNGAGKVSKEAAQAGEVVTFTAVGYRDDAAFLGWYDGATLVSKNLVYQYTVTDSVTLQAKFAGTNLVADISAANWGTPTFGTMKAGESRYGGVSTEISPWQYQTAYFAVNGLKPNTTYTLTYSSKGVNLLGAHIVVPTAAGVEKSQFVSGAYVLGTNTNLVQLPRQVEQITDNITWNDGGCVFTTNATDTDYYILFKNQGPAVAPNNVVVSDMCLTENTIINKTFNFDSGDVSSFIGNGGTVATVDTVAGDPARLGSKYMTFTTTNWQGLIGPDFDYNRVDQYTISFDMKVISYGTGAKANGIDMHLQPAANTAYTGSIATTVNSDGKHNPMLISRYYEDGKLMAAPSYSSQKNSSQFYGRKNNAGVYDVNEMAEAGFDEWQHFEITIVNDRTDSSGRVRFAIRPNDAGWVIGLDNFRVEVIENSTLQNAAAKFTTSGEAAIRKQTDSRPQGMRVKTTLATNLLDVDANGFKVVEYGTLAIASSKLPSAANTYKELVYDMTNSSLKGKKGVAYSAADDVNVIYAEDTEAGTVTFTGVLTGISAANYGKDYTVHAYAILENADDGRRTVVYGEAQQLCVYDVAYSILHTAGAAAGDVAAANTVVVGNQAAYDAWVQANYPA